MWAPSPAVVPHCAVEHRRTVSDYRHGPLQQSSSYRNIGVWRWHADQRRLSLLQEVPSSGLLGVSPDTSALLAGEPGQPCRWAVLAARSLPTRQLQADVQASCLLDRPLDDELRQAFLITGR